VTINNLTRIDIIKNISKKTGFSNLIAKKILNDFIFLLSQNIKKDILILKNIGTFKIIHKKDRPGRNPKTKEKFIISARNTVSFIVSKKLSDNLNK
jgi:integration host factor subunit alpha